MKTIGRLNSNSQTAEVSAVSETILNSAAKGKWKSDVYFTGVIKNMKQKSAMLLAAVNCDKAVSGLEDDDSLRDGCTRAVFHLISGYLYYPESNVVDVATQIKRILDKYGLDITKASYAKETTYISSLLNDLNSSDAKASIELLPGVTALVSKLAVAQTQFENNYTSYKEAKAQADDFANATTLKREVLDIINDELVVYLRAMQKAQPDVYGNFAETVAQIIADSNVEVKKRRKTVGSPQ